MENNRPGLAAAALIALLAVPIGIATFRGQRQKGQPGTPAWIRAHEATLRHISDWPEKPRSLAEFMLDRFGPPKKTARNALTWEDQSYWKRVTVSRTRPEAPLELAVNYLVPPHRLDAVLAFKNGVDVDIWHGELIVSGESEELNHLALNLADEIARELRTTQEAREFYKTSAELSARGKSSRYMESLLFNPIRRPAGSWKNPVFPPREG